jgi:hypothetical protein
MWKNIVSTTCADCDHIPENVQCGVTISISEDTKRTDEIGKVLRKKLVGMKGFGKCGLSKVRDRILCHFAVRRSHSLYQCQNQ